MKELIIHKYFPDNEVSFLHSVGIRAKIIYFVVIIFTASCLISLPLIRVSVSVQGRGIIRPVSGLAEIHSVETGLVTRIFISEGNQVSAGDTILQLETGEIMRQLKYQEEQMTRYDIHIADIKMLLESNGHLLLHSALYQTEWNKYNKKIFEIDSRIIRAETDLAREKQLYDNLLISKKEYEDKLYLTEQLISERKIFETTEKAQWQSDLAKNMQEKENTSMQIDLLNKKLRDYVIIAPVNGTIESFTGIYPNSILQLNQLVAVISPSHTMMAEIQLSVTDVGMVHVNMPVKMQVDAFNYNEWGTLAGIVSSISDDYMIAGNQPVFKVRCSLQSDRLKLRNGTVGLIKKGMTLNARFMVDRRSILSLIYEKSDNWLNPSRNDL